MKQYRSYLFPLLTFIGFFLILCGIRYCRTMQGVTYNGAYWWASLFLFLCIGLFIGLDHHLASLYRKTWILSVERGIFALLSLLPVLPLPYIYKLSEPGVCLVICGYELFMAITTAIQAEKQNKDNSPL